MTDKVQKIREEVERLFNHVKDSNFESDSGAFYYLKDLLEYIDSLQEEPVSKSLEEAARNYSNNLDNICGSIGEQTRNAFKKGAQWQKVNIWKDAQGDDLPEIDREVIILYQRYLKGNNVYNTVGFAHRPKEYWDGRNIETNEVTRYYPKRYDKGDWNIPDVKFWLDLELPTQKGD